MLYFMYIRIQNYDADMKLNVVDDRTDEHLVTYSMVKNDSFDLHFLFVLETLLQLLRNYDAWIERLFNVYKCLTARTHLSTTVSQLFEPQV